MVFAPRGFPAVSDTMASSLIDSIRSCDSSTLLQSARNAATTLLLSFELVAAKSATGVDFESDEVLGYGDQASIVEAGG